MKLQSSIDPRLRVAFLIASAVGIFLLPRIWVAAAAAGALSIAWLVVGLPPRRLVRQYYKLIPFTVFIVGSYAFTREDAAGDRWGEWRILGHALPVSLGGAAVGALMIVRVLAVVLASQVARAGDVRAIAHGLRSLGMPR